MNWNFKFWIWFYLWFWFWSETWFYTDSLYLFNLEKLFRILSWFSLENIVEAVKDYIMEHSICLIIVFTNTHVFIKVVLKVIIDVFIYRLIVKSFIYFLSFRFFPTFFHFCDYFVFVFWFFDFVSEFLIDCLHNYELTLLIYYFSMFILFNILLIHGTGIMTRFSSFI